MWIPIQKIINTKILINIQNFNQYKTVFFGGGGAEENLPEYFSLSPEYDR